MRRITLGFVSLVAMSLLAGCGSDGPAPGDVSVTWKLGFGVACDDPKADIDTIRVRLRAAEAREAAVQSFSCSAGTGTLTNIPPGTYAMELEGGKGQKFTLAQFKATVPVVLVTSNEVTSVGEIAMEKVPPSANPGSIELDWDFEAGLCAANNVDQVRVIVWKELVFRHYDQGFPCDIPAPGFIKLELEPSDYGLQLEGISIEGKTVRRGRKDAVTVEQGKSQKITVVLK